MSLLDNDQLLKARVALNYYLYSIGANELGEPFDKLDSDDLIKDELDTIKTIDCLYHKGHYDKNVSNTINKLNHPPQKIIDYLNRNKELEINKIDGEISKIINKNKNDQTALDKTIVKNNTEKKDIQDAIKTLKDKLEELNNKNEILKGNKDARVKNRNDKISNLKLKKKKILEKEFEYNKHLDTYKKIGETLMKDTNDIQKIIISENESLNPKEPCVGDYFIEDGKCYCLGANKKKLNCHPQSCNLSTKC